MGSKIDKGLHLTEDDIAKYCKEINDIDLSEKSEILRKSLIKINDLMENTKLDQFKLLLVQEISVIYSVLNKTPNLETSVQRKILFALKYFIRKDDDISDEIPEIGYIDDLAVIEWIIQEIKDQYSHYFQA